MVGGIIGFCRCKKKVVMSFKLSKKVEMKPLANKILGKKFPVWKNFPSRFKNEACFIKIKLLLQV